MTTSDVRSWAETYRDEIKVGLAAAAIAFFFSLGLPLWDDDYSQWLAQANAGIFELIKRLLLPYTSEPQAWGFSDRPMQVLIYRVLNLVFGTWGAGFFFVKSLTYGALCGLLFGWMNRAGADRLASLAAVALFALSTNAIASLVRHSDFGIYAQLALAGILCYSFAFIERGPASRHVYRKGLGGLPPAFTRFLLVFFVSVYFGSKIRADVRLAPLILLTFLFVYRREKFFVYLAPFGVTFLATLPWSPVFFKHLPPFVPGASGYEGTTFSAFNVGRLFEFLIGDAFSLSSAPLSVFGGFGILIAVLLAAYGVFLLYQERLKIPGEDTGFFLIWFAFALIGCTMLGRQARVHELRYTLVLLVPAALLCSVFLTSGFQEFARFGWLRPALVAAVVLQCGVHFYRDAVHRREMGRTMIAVDQIYRTVEEKFANAKFVTWPGFASYGYRDSAAPALKERKSLANADEFNKYPQDVTYAVSWSSSLDPRFSLAAGATGCGKNLFDWLFPCTAMDGAVLLKYVGTRSEVAQADDLNNKGNLTGARDVLENYYKKDPGNHGVAFMLGLYNYRLGDFARMEQIYDQFGPYFLTHGSVVYNWGLAKQGVQKYREAGKLLERALAMAPNSYGIGFNLADAYFKQGKRRRALATLGALMKHYPNDGAMKKTYDEWSKR